MAEDGMNGNGKRTRKGGSLPDLGVHVLSEYLFCPRAAVLALESGEADSHPEPDLGPRLGEWADYGEQRFAEELQATSNILWQLMAMLAPALLLTFCLGVLFSLFVGVVAALPACYLIGRCWDTASHLRKLLSEKRMFDRAPEQEINLAPETMIEVNWWTLRKAGFDCLKPQEPHRDPHLRLTGRPWRILTKGTTLRIPVIRKHRGARTWGKQHIIRLAAYCQLIETCEAGQAPFGVLMFSDTYEVKIFPFTQEARASLLRSIDEAREFLRVHREGKYDPKPPLDKRCSGCHRGYPRRLPPMGILTAMREQALEQYLIRALNHPEYHSECGDRFSWVPPHDRAAELKLVQIE